MKAPRAASLYDASHSLGHAGNNRRTGSFPGEGGLLWSRAMCSASEARPRDSASSAWWPSRRLKRLASRAPCL